MAPKIEAHRYPASGIKLAAIGQRALQRKGLYTKSNPRRIFGDISPKRYVFGYLTIGGVDIRQ